VTGGQRPNRTQSPTCKGVREGDEQGDLHGVGEADVLQMCEQGCVRMLMFMCKGVREGDEQGDLHGVGEADVLQMCEQGCVCMLMFMCVCVSVCVCLCVCVFAHVRAFVYACTCMPSMRRVRTQAHRCLPG